MGLENSSSYLLEYYDEIKKGNIIVCKKLKKQLDILIEEMSYEKYRFELEEAHKRIKFIESNCKHSKPPFSGKPFILELWQKAFVEVVYGFKIQDEEKWVRRFTHVLLMLSRKTGKSTLCAALGLAEMYCGEWGTNVVCASNSYDQCDLIYEEIDNMRSCSPKLDKTSRKAISSIKMGSRNQKRKTGKFSSQNKCKIWKMSAKTGAKEGGNIDLGLVDEVHEMKDNSLIEPIVQSGSTKEERCVIEITTQGQVEDGYLDDRYEEAIRHLNGEEYKSRELYWLYEQDSEEEVWQNPSSWQKSSPSLGTVKKVSYLHEMLEGAKTSKAKRVYVLCKDFNIKQGHGTAWLDYDKIKSNGTFDLKDFSGAFYIGGCDFMETTDLMAATFMFRKLNDPVCYRHDMYWMPRHKLEVSNDENQGANYKQWAADGWITMVDDDRVDSSVAADYAMELYDLYGITPYKSGYDNRFAKDYVRRHEENFGKGFTEMVPQSFDCLSTPMRTAERWMNRGIVNYQNNPVTEWCYRNTGIVLDKIGRCMPAKIESKKRIDGTAAWLCAVYVEQINSSDFKNYIR